MVDKWEPSNTIELIALTLTIPGAVAALVTLWILIARRRRIHQGVSRPAHTNTTPHSNQGVSCTPSQAANASSSAYVNQFQDYYHDLHREVTTEAAQWAEEMAYLTRRT
ncbi:hypothetical protein CC86DRAFT_466840 [Ophiobolus disseminans]|uniref:Uncharacterized protein n=1 Tax=Ophiobolus disseminans TaxID=1469910 RepID=A0A6A7A2N7_9PLEO|nr:hypothetical protein CC86DRAFT_466840 [Ophiobolus disseminans]